MGMRVLMLRLDAEVRLRDGLLLRERARDWRWSRCGRSHLDRERVLFCTLQGSEKLDSRLAVLYQVL